MSSIKKKKNKFISSVFVCVCVCVCLCVWVGDKWKRLLCQKCVQRQEVAYINCRRTSNISGEKKM